MLSVCALDCATETTGRTNTNISKQTTTIFRKEGSFQVYSVEGRGQLPSFRKSPGAKKSASGSAEGGMLHLLHGYYKSQYMTEPIHAETTLARAVEIGESQARQCADPLRRERPAQQVLRALYGLTPAECRVALLLGDGHAPRKIVNMVGVTDNTVRSQIKSIFSKTGVKRQGELIRLLMDNSGLAIHATPTP